MKSKKEHLLRRPACHSLSIVSSKLLIAFLCMVLVSSCKKKAVEAGGALPVQVAVPLVEDVTLTKDYPGYLTADATINVVGRVNGVLEKTNFTQGQRVKRGQTLFVIEPQPYIDAVAQAEASLKTARASLSYSRDNYDRMKEAIKSDAVSEIQLLQAEAAVKEGEAQVSSTEAALNQAKLTLSYCYVTSPCDGQINIAVYSNGAYIGGAASPVTMATVYKDDRMYAYFNVADNPWLAQRISEELAQHRTGKVYSVTVVLANDQRQQWRAMLDYLSPNIELNTGTLQVRAELKNPNGLLKAGAYVSITLPYGERSNAVLVPDASIGTDQLGDYLYVVNDSDVVHYRHIETGQLVRDSLRLVNSGLRAGERYVTTALLKVREGMKVTPLQSSPKSSPKGGLAVRQ